MATAAAQVIEEEEARHIHSTHLTEDDHAKNDIDNTRHKLSKRAPVFPFVPFVGPKFAKKAIKFGPKLALKKTVKLPKKALKKTSPFLLKKSVKTLPVRTADCPVWSFFRPDHEYSLPRHPSPVRVI